MGEHRFHTPDPVELEVHVPVGDIQVETVDGDESFVSVTGNEKLVEQTRVELEGRKLIVSLKGKKPFGITISIGDFSFGTGGLHVTVRVPHSSTAALATAAADMKLRGRYGSLETKSASGDLTVTGEIEADATINSVSGDVRVGPVGGELRVTTISGDVLVASVGGSIESKTVSGDVRFDSVREGTLTAQSVSGDIELGVAPARTSTSTRAPCRATSAPRFRSAARPARVATAPRSSCAARPSAATSACSAQHDARVTLVPLRRNRDFVLLQVGQTLSTIGSESTAIAYPLLVLAVTHSPAQAGIVGFARIVPWALFGVAAGVVADRLNRKRVMIVSDVIRLAAVLSLVVVLAVGHVTVVQIALVAFVEGSMFVFFNIAELGALRSVVPGRQLPAAAAAEQARYSTVTLVAPPLGGSLFGLGRTLPFVADVVSYFFSLGSLLLMRTPFQEEREQDDTPVRAQLAEGFHWLWRHRFFRACALLFSWVNLIFEALFLVLIVAGRRQGLSSAQIGLLIAVFGVCSLLGSIAAPRITRLASMRVLVIGNFWLQLGFAVFLLKPDVYVLLAGCVPMAFFLPAVNSAVIGYRTAVVPDRLTGRVGGVARTIALCTAAFGPLSAGLLLHWLSPRETVGVYAAFMLLLCVLGTLNPSIRNAPSLSELDDLPRRPESPEPFLAG